MNNLKIRDTLDQTYLRSRVFVHINGSNIYSKVFAGIRDPLEIIITSRDATRDQLLKL